MGVPSCILAWMKDSNSRILCRCRCTVQFVCLMAFGCRHCLRLCGCGCTVEFACLMAFGCRHCSHDLRPVYRCLRCFFVCIVCLTRLQQSVYILSQSAGAGAAAED